MSARSTVSVCHLFVLTLLCFLHLCSRAGASNAKTKPAPRPGTNRREGFRWARDCLQLPQGPGPSLPPPSLNERLVGILWADGPIYYACVGNPKRPSSRRLQMISSSIYFYDLGSIISADMTPDGQSQIADEVMLVPTRMPFSRFDPGQLKGGLRFNNGESIFSFIGSERFQYTASQRVQVSAPPRKRDVVDMPWALYSENEDSMRKVTKIYQVQTIGGMLPPKFPDRCARDPEYAWEVKFQAQYWLYGNSPLSGIADPCATVKNNSE